MSVPTADLSYRGSDRPGITRLHVVEHRSCREITSGPPILLLHGIGGSARSCGPLADALAAAGHSAWCVDAPGYGASADPADGSDHIGDLVALMGELFATQRAVVVGTSWGGVLAAKLALRHPELVAGLVLADSTRGSGISPERAAAMLARVDELERLGADAVATARAPRLVAPDADPVLADSVRASMASVRLPGFRAAAQFMASTDLGDRLTHLDCPTLVLVGEHDTITGVDESRLIADRIRGARFAVIPDAGHVAIQEQPAAAAELITTFLEELS